MYDAKLSSRSVIHDSAGFAGRAMAEDLENPEDKVRDSEGAKTLIFYFCSISAPLST